MTGALIGAASGLVLGLSLLVWCLRERSKRHDAEADAENARRLLKDSRTAVSRLNTEINVVRKDRDSCNAQIGVLRRTIAGLHEKLAECKDPEAVEKLLNDELGEQL
jgi:uncharacterized coiled-coil DUF342 family protein